MFDFVVNFFLQRAQKASASTWHFRGSSPFVAKACEQAMSFGSTTLQGPSKSRGLNELWSKLLKWGYIGEYMGDYYRGH